MSNPLVLTSTDLVRVQLLASKLSEHGKAHKSELGDLALRVAATCQECSRSGNRIDPGVLSRIVKAMEEGSAAFENAKSTWFFGKKSVDKQVLKDVQSNLIADAVQLPLPLVAHAPEFSAEDQKVLEKHLKERESSNAVAKIPNQAKAIFRESGANVMERKPSLNKTPSLERTSSYSRKSSLTRSNSFGESPVKKVSKLPASGSVQPSAIPVPSSPGHRHNAGYSGASQGSPRSAYRTNSHEKLPMKKSNSREQMSNASRDRKSVKATSTIPVALTPIAVMTTPPATHFSPEENTVDDMPVENTILETQPRKSGMFSICPKCHRAIATDRLNKHMVVCASKAEPDPLAVSKNRRASMNDGTPLKRTDFQKSLPDQSTPTHEPARIEATPPDKRVDAFRSKGMTFKKCPKCKRGFAADRLEKHISVCAGRADPDSQLPPTAITEEEEPEFEKKEKPKSIYDDEYEKIAQELEQCPHCPRKFLPERLAKHMQVEHSRLLFDKSTPSRPIEVDDQTAIHEEVLAQLVACEGCGRKFLPERLDKHMQVCPVLCAPPVPAPTYHLSRSMNNSELEAVVLGSLHSNPPKSPTDSRKIIEKPAGHLSAADFSHHVENSPEKVRRLPTPSSPGPVRRLSSGSHVSITESSALQSESGHDRESSTYHTESQKMLEPSQDVSLPDPVQLPSSNIPRPHSNIPLARRSSRPVVLEALVARETPETFTALPELHREERKRELPNRSVEMNLEPLPPRKIHADDDALPGIRDAPPIEHSSKILPLRDDQSTIREDPSIRQEHTHFDETGRTLKENIQETPKNPEIQRASIPKNIPEPSQKASYPDDLPVDDPSRIFARRIHGPDDEILPVASVALEDIPSPLPSAHLVNSGMSVDDGTAGKDFELVECSKCGRKFLPNRLERHVNVCDGSRPVKKGDTYSTPALKEALRRGREPSPSRSPLPSPHYLAPNNSTNVTSNADEPIRDSTLKKCPICSRTFFSVRLSKHIETCKGPEVVDVTCLSQGEPQKSSEVSIAPSEPSKTTDTSSAPSHQTNPTAHSRTPHPARSPQPHPPSASSTSPANAHPNKTQAHTLTHKSHPPAAGSVEGSSTAGPKTATLRSLPSPRVVVPAARDKRSAPAATPVTAAAKASVTQESTRRTSETPRGAAAAKVPPTTSPEASSPPVIRGIVVYREKKSEENLVGEVIVNSNMSIKSMVDMIVSELGCESGFKLFKNQVPIPPPQYAVKAFNLFRNDSDVAILAYTKK